MIEIIYSNEENNTGRSNIMFKMPKNIRQIGEINSSKKIYIEDYVITYMKQLAANDYINQYVAVLLGQHVKIDKTNNIFISGAIEVKDAKNKEQSEIFTNETWTNVYENVKKYFNDLEIVGWYFAKPGYMAELNDDIVKNHINNFAGQDKALLLHDSLEKEDAFYIYENNELKKQTGYYIYYEKNEEMQNYMIEEREIIAIEEESKEAVVKDIRAIIQDKKQETTHKNMHGVIYSVSTAFAIVILVIAVTMLNNYDKMKAMEQTLNNISEKLHTDLEEKNGITDDEAVAVFNNNSKPIQIETVEGNIHEIDETEPITNEIFTTENQLSNSDSPTQEPTTKELTQSTTVETTEPTTEPTANQKTEDSTKENDKKEESIKESTNESKSSKEESKNSTKNSNNNQIKSSEAENTTIEVVNSSGEVVKYYTIKKGDTLIDICKSIYGNLKNLETLQKMNEIEDPNLIFADQKLIIP